MSEYSVYSLKPSGLPTATTSYTIELTGDFQLKGTLKVLGAATYVLGSKIGIGGVVYRITNVSSEESGSAQTAVYVLRNEAYELNHIMPLKNYSWITAPDYILRSEELSNRQETVKTELRTRPGSVFGVDGWTMEAIIKDLIETQLSGLGWTVNYDLPDFGVKQVSIDRKTSVLAWLRSMLAPFLPRIYVVNDVLHITPAKGSGTVATLTELEVVSHSETYQEPYNTLRISGGMGEFDKDEWEGGSINTTPATLTVFMNDKFGSITTSYFGGARAYYNSIKTGTELTISATYYSKDPFNNDGVLLFQGNWQFRQLKPDTLQYIDNKDAFFDATFKDYDVETTTAPSWPDKADYAFVSHDRTVYKYEGTSIEWERPLLVETHKAVWGYNIWSTHVLSGTKSIINSEFWSAFVPTTAEATGYKNPPDPSTVLGDDIPLGFPTGFSPTIDPAYLSSAVASVDQVKAVFSTNISYTVTRNKYQYSGVAAAAFDILGGLLKEVRTVEWGTVRTTQVNIRLIDGKPFYFEPERCDGYVPSQTDNYSPLHAVPLVSFVQLGSRIEKFKRESPWTVRKHINEFKVKSDRLNWAEVSDPKERVTNVQVQFTASHSSEIIPFGTAPQALVKKRAMILYRNFAGSSGKRFVEINFPLIVSWSDLDIVAPKIKEVHPTSNSIITTIITSPEVVNLTIQMLGAEASIPNLPSGISMGSNQRIVAATVNFDGQGGVYTQVAIQGERSV